MLLYVVICQASSQREVVAVWATVLLVTIKRVRSSSRFTASCQHVYCHRLPVSR